jgi:hypothetical protein
VKRKWKGERECGLAWAWLEGGKPYWKKKGERGLLDMRHLLTVVFKPRKGISLDPIIPRARSSSFS